jgi:hypothetical protein
MHKKMGSQKLPTPCRLSQLRRRRHTKGLRFSSPRILGNSYFGGEGRLGGEDLEDGEVGEPKGNADAARARRIEILSCPHAVVFASFKFLYRKQCVAQCGTLWAFGLA